MKSNLSMATINNLSRRRVHQDGMSMLETNGNYKDTFNKMVLMENRVRRLLYEEERSKKL